MPASLAAGLLELGQGVPHRGAEASPWGRRGVGRSRGQHWGGPCGGLACKLPPALLHITQVLPPISEKLTSNKRAL